MNEKEKTQATSEKNKLETNLRQEHIVCELTTALALER